MDRALPTRIHSNPSARAAPSPAVAVVVAPPFPPPPMTERRVAGSSSLSAGGTSDGPGWDSVSGALHGREGESGP